MTQKALQTLSILGLFSFVGSASAWACNGSHILGAGGAGAIHTLSAGTMKKGDMFVGINTENIINNSLSDTRIIEATKEGVGHIHNVDSVSTYALAFAYGVTDNLTLNINLPYSVRRNIRAGGHGHGSHLGEEAKVHAPGDTKGISDMAAILQYKLYDKDNMQMAVLGGVKAPTGKTDFSFGEDKIPETDLQPGSGSWDFFSGAVLSRNFSDFSLHGSFLYKHTTQNDKGIALGNILDYGLAFSYKIKEEHAHIFVANTDEHFDYSANVFLEINGENVMTDTHHGVDIENTGHHVIYATTGVQVFEKSGYSGFVAIGVPIYQDLVGLQNEANYRFSLGIGKSF